MEAQPPAQGKYIHGRRLVWLTGAMSAGAWNQHWDIGTAPLVVARARAGKYDWRELYRSFIPADGKVLDGGCGLGATVAGLRSDGYDAIGIEQSEEMVEFISEYAVDCPVSVGDVANLAGYADGEFDAYVSLGVVEHFRDGPGTALEQAARVLKPGGHAFISVPFINCLRQTKMKLGLYPRLNSEPSGRDFYQQAFERSDFEDELRRAGLVPVWFRPTSTLAGIRRELGQTVTRAVAFPPLRKVTNALEYLPGAPRAVGHMAMYVAAKPL